MYKLPRGEIPKPSTRPLLLLLRPILRHIPRPCPARPARPARLQILAHPAYILSLHLPLPLALIPKLRPQPRRPVLLSLLLGRRSTFDRRIRLVLPCETRLQPGLVRFKRVL